MVEGEKRIKVLQQVIFYYSIFPNRKQTKQQGDNLPQKSMYNETFMLSLVKLWWHFLWLIEI